MNALTKTTIVFVGVGLSACAESPEIKVTALPHAEIGRQPTMKGLTPAQLFDADISANKMHFLGVRGYTTIAPGIDDYFQRYAATVPLKIIEGTSDAVKSEADRKFNSEAFAFAKQYNALLQARLQTKKPR